VEIAWAAGLFEGEGTMSYSPRHVRACLNMTDFEVVERFAEVVGVGTLAHKPSHDPRHKDQLVWRVTDYAGVQHVFALLRPWLGARRVAQGEYALRKMAEGIAATQAKREAVCRNGHRRTAENTRMQHRKSGTPYRRCLDCGREWAQKA
jgi:hypothetical protein